MWPPTRKRKTSLFWLAVAACGGGISGILIVVVSMMVILVIALTIFVNIDSKSSQFGSQSSPGVSNVPLNVTTNWTGERNQAVVNSAIHLAAALYNGPPDGYDTWYHADMIPDVSCTECGDWPQGDVQCVAFITAAYALAGQPLPYWRNMNAIDYYASGDYLNTPHWEELSPLSMPEPGDIVVLDSPFFGGVGHVVLVVDVKPPQNGQAGYVQFAQANGPGSINQEPLTQDASGGLHMQIWPQYTIKCYIRHSAASKVVPL